MDVFRAMLTPPPSVDAPVQDVIDEVVGPAPVPEVDPVPEVSPEVQQAAAKGLAFKVWSSVSTLRAHLHRGLESGHG